MSNAAVTYCCQTKCIVYHFTDAHVSFTVFMFLPSGGHGKLTNCSCVFFPSLSFPLPQQWFSV